MEPIDLCISLSGPNVDVLFRVFWGSLDRHCNKDGVSFHLINRDCPAEVIDPIRDRVYPHCVYFYNLPKITSDTKPFNDDVAYSCDWMVNNCGVNKWMGICHFDIMFKKDWISAARSRISGDAAMIGQHCAAMLLNREAYPYTRFKFATIAPFVVLRWTNGEYVMRFKGDARVGTDALPIWGFDTCHLMELELRGRGWFVDIMGGEVRGPGEWYDHFGGGGSHYNEPEKSMHRVRAMRFINEHSW